MSMPKYHALVRTVDIAVASNSNDAAVELTRLVGEGYEIVSSVGLGHNIYYVLRKKLS